MLEPATFCDLRFADLFFQSSKFEAFTINFVDFTTNFPICFVTLQENNAPDQYFPSDKIQTFVYLATTISLSVVLQHETNLVQISTPAAVSIQSHNVTVDVTLRTVSTAITSGIDRRLPHGDDVLLGLQLQDSQGNNLQNVGYKVGSIF